MTYPHTNWNFFEHITKTILEHEESEIKILIKEICIIMRGLAWLTPHAIHNLKCKIYLTKGLTEVIGYIQYHNYNVEHTTWLTFDEDAWLQLPHATYATALDPLVNPDPRCSKAVASIASVSSTDPTHTLHVSAPTKKWLLSNIAYNNKCNRIPYKRCPSLSSKIIYLSTMIYVSKVHNTIYISLIQIK